MSAENYQLKIGDAAKANFAALGVRGARLTLGTWGADSLEISVAQDVDLADIITPFQRVELYDLANTRRFVGWLDSSPRSAASGSETKSYVLTGPIRWLDRTYYVPEPEAGGSRPHKDHAPQVFGAIILGMKYDPSGDATPADRRSPVSDQVAAIVEYLGEEGITLPAPPTTAPWDLFVPRETYQNVTCLAAIQSLLKWLPMWCLVSDGGDSLVWRDMLAGTLHPVGTLLAAGEQCSLTPRFDLLRSSVKLIYQTSAEGGTVKISTDQANGGDFAGARKEVVIIPLENNEAVPAAGLAAQYLRWVGKLQIETSLQCEGDMRWDILPGHRLSLEGILSAWASYDAVIQVVERDLATDRITLRTGPRRHLGLDQLVALHRRKSGAGLGGGNDAGSGPGGGGDGGGADTSTATMIMMGLPEGVDAHWAVGDAAGVGSGTATLPSGSYTAIFAPAWDAEEGRLYFADPDGPKTLPATFTANYTAVHRLKLQGKIGNEEITIDSDAIPEDQGPAQMRLTNGVINGSAAQCYVLRTELESL